jgi:hypothetical protein
MSIYVIPKYIHKYIMCIMHIMSIIKSILAHAAHGRRRHQAYAPACNCGDPATARRVHEHVLRFVPGNGTNMLLSGSARRAKALSLTAGALFAWRVVLCSGGARSLTTGAPHGWPNHPWPSWLAIGAQVDAGASSQGLIQSIR